MKPDNADRFHTSPLAYIDEHLPMSALAAQLAEEAAELAQAALKLHRIYEGINPTPVSEADAVHNLFEEIGDVLCCVNAISYPRNNSTLTTVLKIAECKAKRWAARIEASLD